MCRPSDKERIEKNQKPKAAVATSNMAPVMAIGVLSDQNATTSVEIAPANILALPNREEATPAICGTGSMVPWTIFGVTMPIENVLSIRNGMAERGVIA